MKSLTFLLQRTSKLLHFELSSMPHWVSLFFFFFFFLFFSFFFFFFFFSFLFLFLFSFFFFLSKSFLFLFLSFFDPFESILNGVQQQREPANECLMTELPRNFYNLEFAKIDNLPDTCTTTTWKNSGTCFFQHSFPTLDMNLQVFIISFFLSFFLILLLIISFFFFK